MSASATRAVPAGSLPVRAPRFSALARRTDRSGPWACRGLLAAGYLAGVGGAAVTMRVPNGSDVPGALLRGAIPLVVAMAAALYLPLLASPLAESRSGWLRWPAILAMLPGALGSVALALFFLEWDPSGLALPLLTLVAIVMQCGRLVRRAA